MSDFTKTGRRFSFDDELVKPSWIAWDSTLGQGECIRCGDALGLLGLTRDLALTQHILAHRDCAPDEADRRKAKREAEDTRRRIEMLGLVEGRSGESPSRLANLLRDKNVLTSKDPVIREALGRAMLALSDIMKASRQPASGVELDALTGYAAGYAGARFGQRDRDLPVDPSSVEVKLGIDEVAFSNLRAKLIEEAMEKMLPPIPSLTKSIDVGMARQLGGKPVKMVSIPLLGGTMVQTCWTGVWRTENDQMEVRAGDAFQVASSVSRRWSGSVVDLKLNFPGYIGNIELRDGDLLRFDGSISVLNEYKAAVMRDRKIAVVPGRPFILRGKNRTAIPLQLLEADLVIELDEPDESGDQW